MADPRLARGGVWLAGLDPTLGREQRGRRSVLVVSADAYNAAETGLVIVLPLTSKLRPIPARVRVLAAEGGLRVDSDILCDQVRAVATERLAHYLGAASAETMGQVDERLRFLLAL